MSEPDSDIAPEVQRSSSEDRVLDGPASGEKGSKGMSGA